jgi:hypothetical protein
LILICSSLGTAAAQGKQEVTQPVHPVADMFFQKAIAHLGSGGFVDAALVKELHGFSGIRALRTPKGLDPSGLDQCSTAGDGCPIGETFCDCARAAATSICGQVGFFECTPRGFVSCNCAGVQ